jgi:ribosomal protein S27AE
VLLSGRRFLLPPAPGARRVSAALTKRDRGFAMDVRSQHPGKPRCFACGVGVSLARSVEHDSGIRTITFKCDRCGYVWDETALHEEAARLLGKLPSPAAKD